MHTDLMMFVFIDNFPIFSMMIVVHCCRLCQFIKVLSVGWLVLVVFHKGDVSPGLAQYASYKFH